MMLCVTLGWGVFRGYWLMEEDGVCGGSVSSSEAPEEWLLDTSHREAGGHRAKR